MSKTLPSSQQASSQAKQLSDAEVAQRMQAEEDAALAQRLDDERLAQQHDPWQQAANEWDTVMKQHDASSGEKVAKEIHAREAHALKLKAQREEEDRKLALQLAAGGSIGSKK